MRRPFEKKYLFTQLSAPLVGSVGVFLLIRLFHSVADFNSFSGNFKVLLTRALFLIGLMVFMVLWGRILVWLGILTREEAKGYPYSNPWEKLIRKAG